MAAPSSSLRSRRSSTLSAPPPSQPPPMASSTARNRATGPTSSLTALPTSSQSPRKALAVLSEDEEDGGRDDRMTPSPSSRRILPSTPKSRTTLRKEPAEEVEDEGTELDLVSLHFLAQSSELTVTLGGRVRPWQLCIRAGITGSFQNPLCCAHIQSKSTSDSESSACNVQTGNTSFSWTSNTPDALSPICAQITSDDSETPCSLPFTPIGQTFTTTRRRQPRSSDPSHSSLDYSETTSRSG